MFRISHCLSYFWGVTFFTVLFPCLARGGTHVGLSRPYKDGLELGWNVTICCWKMFFPLLLLLFSSALAAWQPDAPPGYQLIYKKTLTVDTRPARIEKPHILSADELTTPKPEPCTEGSACKQQGHSCNIGNAPSLVGKKLKTVICVFWMHIWYGFTFTKMEKVMGKLKKMSTHIFGQMFDFFCPEEILAFSCKISCQSFDFICQALEKSLQFADKSYRLKEYICFRVFLKIRFFGQYVNW